MASEYFAAYRAMIGGADPSLDSVFSALESRPDLFAQIVGKNVRLLPVLVYDDRARPADRPQDRLWRPTVELVSAQAFEGVHAAATEKVILTAAGFPAAIGTVSADMVRPGPEVGRYAARCADAVAVLELTHEFVGRYRNLISQGADAEKIPAFPPMRALAERLHRASVEFAAAFNNGLQVPAAILTPPHGARQFGPGAWLPSTEQSVVDTLPAWQPPAAVRVPHRSDSAVIVGAAPSRSSGRPGATSTPPRHPGLE